MPKAKGVIDAIAERIVQTKNGPKPVYAMVIEGQKYHTGFDKPYFNKGDEVEVEFNVDKFGKQVYNTALASSRGGEEGSTISNSLLIASNIISRGSTVEELFSLSKQIEDRLKVNKAPESYTDFNNVSFD